jgi:NADPH:quinone reductase-like Zn-dependent oxidoreductase
MTAHLPRPGVDQVLVRVHAAGIVVDGPPAAGARCTVQVRDIAGTVVAFGGGDGQGRFVVGEEVYGILPPGRSTAADHVVLPATALSIRPQTTSFAESAALPSAAVKAWNGLVELGGVHAGHTVLVRTGTCASAMYAIQLAALAGATVVAVAGDASAPLLQELGAQEVVAADGCSTEGVDVLFDPTTVEIDLATHPTFEVPAGEPHLQHPWRPGTAMPPFAHGFAVRTPEPQLALIADLVDSGVVRPVLDRSFPIADAAAAIEHARTSTAPGTTVLVIR